MAKQIVAVTVMVLGLLYSATSSPVSVPIPTKRVDECGGLVDAKEGLIVYSYNEPFVHENCIWTVSADNDSSLGALEFTLLADGFTETDYFDWINIFYIGKNGSLVHADGLKYQNPGPVIVESRLAFIFFGHYFNPVATEVSTGFIVQFRGVAGSGDATSNNAITNTGRFHADLTDTSITEFSYPGPNTPKINEYATFVIQNRNNTSGAAPSMHVKVDNLDISIIGSCDSESEGLFLYGMSQFGYMWNWPQLAAICSSGPTFDIGLRPGQSLIAVFTSPDEHHYDANTFRLSWN